MLRSKPFGTQHEFPTAYLDFLLFFIFSTLGACSIVFTNDPKTVKFEKDKVPGLVF